MTEQLNWTELNKEMAAHSSIPAWRIPWTEQPGGLQSAGSQRVGHDWATSLSLFNIDTRASPVASGKECTRSAGDKRCGFDPWVRKVPWSRNWQPAPVFLPGESHGQRSLMGNSPWGHKESDTTEQWKTHNIDTLRDKLQSKSKMQKDPASSWRVPQKKACWVKQ